MLVYEVPARGEACFTVPELTGDPVEKGPQLIWALGFSHKEAAAKFDEGCRRQRFGAVQTTRSAFIHRRPVHYFQAKHYAGYHRMFSDGFCREFRILMESLFDRL
jgi:hypothetical protein